VTENNPHPDQEKREGVVVSGGEKEGMQWLKLQPVLSTVLLAEVAEELKVERLLSRERLLLAIHLFRMLCRVYEDCTTLIIGVLWG
jgi:hypothetical protein